MKRLKCSSYHYLKRLNQQIFKLPKVGFQIRVKNTSNHKICFVSFKSVHQIKYLILELRIMNFSQKWFSLFSNRQSFNELMRSNNQTTNLVFPNFFLSLRIWKRKKKQDSQFQDWLLIGPINIFNCFFLQFLLITIKRMSLIRIPHFVNIWPQQEVLQPLPTWLGVDGMRQNWSQQNLEYPISESRYVWKNGLKNTNRL